MNSQAFLTICKASLVSVILMANRFIFVEFAANINCLHSPLCERSITMCGVAGSLLMCNDTRGMRSHSTLSRYVRIC